MNREDRLHELLERWEDLLRQGQEVPAEELCRDDPELLDELRRRVAALQAMNRLLDAGEGAGAGSGRSPAPPPMLGRYRLDELIGTGGYGQVWKGFDPQLGRVVAIKVPRLERISTPGQMERFLDEARRIAQLKHPGIVPVHDAGCDGRWCYIVSDFIEGTSLAQKIAEHRPTWEESVRLVVAVAQALHHAHRHSIIHRDVKPANILLDKDGEAFLADFGVATSEEELHRHTASTVGTLAYMSPEQAQGVTSRVDGRTDIYSLGVVLYQLLTGRLPFLAETDISLRQAITTAEPKPPRSITETVPVDLDRVCLKALAKEPSARYSTASDFAADLLATLRSRRPRWIAWTVAAGGLAVIAALLSSGYWANGTRPQQPDRGAEAVEQLLSDIKDYATTADPKHELSVKRQAEETQKVVEQAEAQVREITTVPFEAKPRKLNADPPSQVAAAEPLDISVFEASLDLSGRILTEADYRRLEQCLTLRELNLTDTPTTDRHIERLSPMLETLDLSGTKITDEGLKSLATHMALTRLVLAGTKLTDAGLQYLRQMRLRHLNLSHTGVSAAGLQYLCDPFGVGGCLEDIDLSNTAINDAAVEHLKKMKRLTSVKLTGTKITDQGNAELQTALPECKVER